MLPHFRYLQDVVRYVNTLERQVDDTLNRTKDMRLLGNLLPRTYRPSVDQAVHAYRPKITQSMLARASTIGIENLQIQAAFETFVITQKSDKAKKKKIDINQKVVVPNAKKLADQYALAEDLHEKYVTLQNVEAQITMQFRDSRDLPKVLKSVKSAKAKVEKALREVFAYLADVANKHVPESFTKYVQAIADELSDHVVFRSSRSFIYVHVSPLGALVFTSYILMEDALNEDGELTPTLYVALQWNQGVFSSKGSEEPSIRLWLDQEFEMPQVLARRPDGATVGTVNTAAQALGRLLDLENFSSSIGVIPLSLQLKVDPSAISKKNFSFRDYVQSVQVDSANNVLRFTMSRVRGVDKDSVQKIAIALYPEVKQMLKVGRSAKVRMKVYRSGDYWMIDFIVTGLAKGNSVSVDDLEFLKERFGLNDRQLRRISDVFSAGDR